MCSEKNDNIVSLCLHKLSELISYALGNRLDEQWMCAPTIDNTPLYIGRKWAAIMKMYISFNQILDQIKKS